MRPPVASHTASLSSANTGSYTSCRELYTRDPGSGRVPYHRLRICSRCCFRSPKEEINDVKIRRDEHIRINYAVTVSNPL